MHVKRLEPCWAPRECSVHSRTILVNSCDQPWRRGRAAGDKAESSTTLCSERIALHVAGLLRRESKSRNEFLDWVGMWDSVPWGTEADSQGGGASEQMRPHPCLEQSHDMVQRLENCPGSGSLSLPSLSLDSQGTQWAFWLGRTSSQLQPCGPQTAVMVIQTAASQSHARLRRKGHSQRQCPPFSLASGYVSGDGLHQTVPG